VTPPPFAFDSPAAARAALLEETEPVAVESCPLAEASGRILAQPLLADRPSPACDVSAMDGYAVRLVDLATRALEVSGHARIGSQPPEMPAGSALHIVTGAPVPAGAEAVVRREDVIESPGRIELRGESDAVRPGANIRRQGENLDTGAKVLAPGAAITPPVAAALSMFGEARPAVYRRVRVAILITGDEVLGADASPTPWQLRDANGPALAAMLGTPSWCDCDVAHVPDDEAALASRVAEALESADALVLTGGVSMGDRDYVPAVLAACGCRTLFHKLPQRPGKPLLGAVASGGKPVLGLPGNPVSVLVTARRYALPALQRRAGLRDQPHPRLVTLDQTDDRTLGMWWYRLVRTNHPGVVSLASSRGSGDLPSAAGSDGFIEIPPDTRADRLLPFYSWSG
jgi:molybdopterin molybdotransferase